MVRWFDVVRTGDRQEPVGDENLIGSDPRARRDLTIVNRKLHLLDMLLQTKILTFLPWDCRFQLHLLLDRNHSFCRHGCIEDTSTAVLCGIVQHMNFRRHHLQLPRKCRNKTYVWSSLCASVLYLPCWVLGDRMTTISKRNGCHNQRDKTNRASE